MQIQPIILCGGDGNRLWPLSRTSYPKQLLAPFGGLSLLQRTAKRFDHPQYKKSVFVCNEQYRFLVAEQLQAVGFENPLIILEPESLDTANAIALAVHYVNTPLDYSIIVPSDHLIQHEDLFHAYVQQGVKAAEQGFVVTFGIKPDCPATGYGYIQASDEYISKDILKVEKFIEKPNSETAKTLLQQGYYWNGGIFLAQNQVLGELLNTYLPDQYALTHQAIQSARKDLDFIRAEPTSFKKCQKISIDIGVMEKAIARVAVVPCSDMGWSDVGNWQSVYDHQEKNAQGNVVVGDVITQDVHNSYLRSEGLLVSVIGVQDIIIVASSDAVLVARKQDAEKVKEMALTMRQQMRSEADTHRRVYRPWGYYQEIDIGERFKVKRLMVKPLQKTSTQIHYHRSEHWVVVHGTANVLIGDKVKLLHENESVHIPAGVQHAIENPGKIDIHLIEVQSGSYLGEDDILRIQDIYGRVENVG